MANVIRIKRRASGNAGAPATLKNAELAYNEVDGILYYGKGSDGSGNATTIPAVAGPGYVVDKSSDQSIDGNKSFVKSPIVPTPAVDDSSTKAATTAFVHGQLANAAPVMDGVATVGTSLKSARQDHVHPSDTTKAPLASPTFTGTPAAPTASTGTSTTQIATTAFVAAAVAALVNSSPAALDTLKELADALGGDANFATTMTNSLASKLAKASNLSDLADIAAARANLQLLSMALQAANAVAITGGSVNNVTMDGVTYDGGTF